MGYKFRDIRGTSSGTTPLGPLRAGRSMKRDRVMSAFADADRTLGNGSRVLGRVGLHGEAAQQIVSTTTSSGAVQTYPLKTASRVALRGKYLLTPGHFVRVSVLALPSGATQKLSGGGSYVLDAVVGWIDVTAQFSGGASDTVTHTFSLPASDLQYGGEGTDAGWAWAALRRFESPLLAPSGAVKNSADLRNWCEEITCEVTIAYRGGVRCVDCVVQEVPFGYARSINVDATSTYSSPLAVVAGGQAPGVYPPIYPVEETSATDPTFGSNLLADVVDRQQTRLGPVLAPWSGWRESQAVTTTSAVGITTTATAAFTNMCDNSITAWASASPGWSLASGGQAQQFSTSEARRITRDKDACVPVRVWIYGSRTGSGTALVRVQSEGYSVAEVSFTNTTDGWSSATGHLRCGLGPEDTSVMQILGKLAAAGTLTVRHIVVEYLDT